VNTAKQNDASYTYSLDDNGCQTGSHSFYSLGDYCAALENNSLNNGCAQTERGNLFSQKCPGGFSPSKANQNLNQTTHMRIDFNLSPGFISIHRTF
jgi:hypothetical protein